MLDNNGSLSSLSPFPLKSLKQITSTTGDKIIEAHVQLALANMETAQEKKYPANMQRV